MRASFSSWCDEYYNLKMLLIGELFRSKAILERRQAAVKTHLKVDFSKNKGSNQDYISHSNFNTNYQILSRNVQGLY